MLALSIRQPHIGRIIRGLKPSGLSYQIEVRTWATNHRGPLALHCSAGGPKGHETPGAVVAQCSVSDCLPLAQHEAGLLGIPWWDEPIDGLWGWHLVDVRLVAPVKWKGNARFFKVPDELIISS